VQINTAESTPTYQQNIQVVYGDYKINILKQTRIRKDRRQGDKDPHGSVSSEPSSTTLAPGQRPVPCLEASVPDPRPDHQGPPASAGLRAQLLRGPEPALVRACLDAVGGHIQLVFLSAASVRLFIRPGYYSRRPQQRAANRLTCNLVPDRPFTITTIFWRQRAAHCGRRRRSR
jgi:hypothetical protein